MDAFGLEKVTKYHNPRANGGCLPDGTISITFLTCTVNAPRGADKAKEWTGLHHVGFWAEDVSATRDDWEAAGGAWIMGRVAESEDALYDLKHMKSGGNIFNIAHNDGHSVVKGGPGDGTNPT